MHVMKQVVFSVILAAVAILTACTTAPETGRLQLILIDSAQEAKIGFQAFREMKRKESAIAGGSKVRLLQRVGKRIAAVAKVPHAQWEFVLFKDPNSANAFALPGGKVGVYTGILPITKNEAGLATVIAHEIAHVTARHGAERMSQSMLIDVGGSVLSSALGNKATHDMIMQAYSLGTTVGVALSYSRTQESEADHVGLLYMARAGYDPREAVKFWQRFRAHNKGRKKPLEFLSTHPHDETRIAALKRMIPGALQEYKRAKARR